MTSRTSPALARRQLRLALRRAREAAGITQGQVADALEWSISKVNRIETGDVKVSNSDLAALLRLFAVDDPALVADFTDRARASRRRGWWDEPHARKYLPAPYRQLIEFEDSATVIRCFQPTLVPGILQTETYAREILETWSQELDDDVRTARVEFRLRRRSNILDGDGPPDYLLILDESVVMREVGGALGMAEQLKAILSLIKSGRIHVRILPLREGAPFSVYGAFYIFDVETEENALFYQESVRGDMILQGTDQVAEYRACFDLMWSISLDEAASVRLMEAYAARMLASLDRTPRM